MSPGLSWLSSSTASKIAATDRARYHRLLQQSGDSALPRIGPTGDFDNRRIIKVARKGSGSIVAEVIIIFRSGRRGSTLSNSRAENRYSDYVRALRHNDGVVLHQQAVLLDLCQQDPSVISLTIVLSLT